MGGNPNPAGGGGTGGVRVSLFHEMLDARAALGAGGARGGGGRGAATAVAPDAVTHPYPHRFDGALFYYTTIDGVVTLPPQHRESRWSRARGGRTRGG